MSITLFSSPLIWVKKKIITNHPSKTYSASKFSKNNVLQNGATSRRFRVDIPRRAQCPKTEQNCLLQGISMRIQPTLGKLCCSFWRLLPTFHCIAQVSRDPVFFSFIFFWTSCCNSKTKLNISTPHTHTHRLYTLYQQNSVFLTSIVVP